MSRHKYAAARASRERSAKPQPGRTFYDVLRSTTKDKDVLAAAAQAEQFEKDDRLRASDTTRG